MLVSSWSFMSIFITLSQLIPAFKSLIVDVLQHYLQIKWKPRVCVFLTSEIPSGFTLLLSVLECSVC